MLVKLQKPQVPEPRWAVDLDLRMATYELRYARGLPFEVPDFHACKFGGIYFIHVLMRIVYKVGGSASLRVLLFPLDSTRIPSIASLIHNHPSLISIHSLGFHLSSPYKQLLLYYTSFPLHAKEQLQLSNTKDYCRASRSTPPLNLHGCGLPSSSL